MLKQPVIKEVQLQYIINKSVFIAIILAAALGTSSAQGPPAFVTLQGTRRLRRGWQIKSTLCLSA